MSPRNLLSSALRQCKSCISQQHATLSTSSRMQAFKRIPNSASASGNILGLDGPDTQDKRQDATDLALKYAAVERGQYAQRRLARQEETAKRLADQSTSDNYMRMMPRRWNMGDVYAPRDIGPEEASKWRPVKAPKKDILDKLGVNPLDSYQNFSMISEYMTSMGRIKHNQATGLRPVNQRKMAKAIRRAIGLGIHPSVHKYPEIIKWNNEPVGIRSFTPKGSSESS